ncbi:nitronate monooxygenase family protein [Clostridium sediminicola]|uniref:NAD(P)H-dependent flavin oxidoreductase n=1 Tax=Clostridium sediminicola TaxID=3114879 RepID=UPI0031F23E65
MNLPKLKIGDFVAKVPIIQGGMGVGVSKSKLAAAVANTGCIGVISAVQLGYNEPDFENNFKDANLRSLKSEIQKARKLSPNGILGINVLNAAKNYEEIVKTAVEEKIDLIISGAGLPVDLPKFIKNTKTKIIPIVSSGKAAKIITKMWVKKYDYIPDAIIVEGKEAGGHLGFALKDLLSTSTNTLQGIVKEVLDVIKGFEEKYKKNIPVIAAGGIFTGKDIAEYIKMGAAGVQMATSFVATDECDAHINFKNAYINSKKEDIKLIKSPVGMPGRAINNNFVKALENGRIPIKKCYTCLKTCDPKTTPFCISKALINAVNGDVDNGLVFAGSNAYRLTEIKPVKTLVDELVNEAESYL